MAEQSPNEALHWLAVLGPDGTVVATAGGVPASWRGSPIGAIEDLPKAVREAGSSLVREVHHPQRSAAASCHVLSGLPGTPTLQMIAVEAVPLRREATDLPALLHSALAVFEAQAHTMDVTLRVEVDATVEAWLDAGKIAWAVTTLVGNSLRYVKHGTRRMPGGSITVKLGFVPERDEAVIIVEDDGPGIPADKLPWLLRRKSGQHHTPAPALMLIHDVITGHGGSVEVRSNQDDEDHGTAITLRFPVR